MHDWESRFFLSALLEPPYKCSFCLSVCPTINPLHFFFKLGICSKKAVCPFLKGKRVNRKMGDPAHCSMLPYHHAPLSSASLSPCPLSQSSLQGPEPLLPFPLVPNSVPDRQIGCRSGQRAFFSFHLSAVLLPPPLLSAVTGRRVEGLVNRWVDGWATCCASLSTCPNCLTVD